MGIEKFQMIHSLTLTCIGEGIDFGPMQELLII